MSARTVVAGHILLSLLVAAIWPVCETVGVAPDTALRLLAVGLLLLTLGMIASWRLVGRKLFEPYGMFLVSALLFHGGQVYLELLGLNANGILNSEFSPETTAQAVALVISAVAAMHLGALAAVMRARPAVRVPRASASRAEIMRSCRTVGIALLVISFVPAAIEMKDRFATVYESGYYALYQGDFATGIAGAAGILAMFLVPGVLFLLAGSGPKLGLRLLCVVIVGLYVLSYLFTGYRGFAAMLAVAHAWVWHRCVRPLPRTVMVVTGIVTMILVFPLVAAVRNVSGPDRSSLEFLKEAYLSIDNPMVASISEMGASLVTLTYTLELVPSTRSFDYGLGYLYALASVFPNLFWDLHPAIARGTPSEWLIWTVDPITARNGGGLGYSFVAEAYLNFGSVGVPFVMVVLGYFLSRFALWADDGPSPSPARIAAVAAFTAFSLSFARGEALFIMRPLLWQAFAPYVATIVVQKIRAGRLTQPSRVVALRTS